MSHINVLDTNSRNITGIPKKTDEAIAIIRKCKFVKIVMQLAVSEQDKYRKNEKEITLSKNEIIYWLTGSEIADLHSGSDNAFTIAVHTQNKLNIGCGLVIMDSIYDYCEISWDGFVSNSYFD